jgi:hypothetical protein
MKMATDIIEQDPFDPKKIFDALIKRCKQAKAWEIRCIVDEAFIGPAPFDIYIEDGVFYCRVIAPTLKDAYVEVANKLPVIKFLKYTDEK